MTDTEVSAAVSALSSLTSQPHARKKTPLPRFFSAHGKHTAGSRDYNYSLIKCWAELWFAYKSLQAGRDYNVPQVTCVVDHISTKYISMTSLQKELDGGFLH